jgi:hypothetical protein
MTILVMANIFSSSDIALLTSITTPVHGATTDWPCCSADCARTHPLRRSQLDLLSLQLPPLRQTLVLNFGDFCRKENFWCGVPGGEDSPSWILRYESSLYPLMRAKSGSNEDGRERTAPKKRDLAVPKSRAGVRGRRGQWWCADQ